MATSIQPTDPTPAPSRGPRTPFVAPAMTRCECAGVTFEEVARRMYAERLSVEQAVRRTGCGQNCGACIPDLVQFLSRS